MNKKLSILAAAVLFASSLTVLISSCGKDDDATPDPLMVATSIELVSGNEQTAEVLATLANPVVILVKNLNGDAIAGKTVSFTVSEGSISNATVTTDANGNASAIWTLGSTIGTQSLKATVEGLTDSPVVFSATGNQITVRDIDGNTYNAVVIGYQVWMVENLKTTHYADGTPIPLVTDNTVWKNLSDNRIDDAYCYYNNDANSEYGSLYTWAAAMNGSASSSTNPSGIQGACPDGWHVPSDAEWTELTDYLGGKSIAGGKMKERGTAHWNSPTGATNKSGFKALPGGRRFYYDGSFADAGEKCYLWSSTETSSTRTYNRFLYNSTIAVYEGDNYYKSNGYSVRCLKD